MPEIILECSAKAAVLQSSYRVFTESVQVFTESKRSFATLAMQKKYIALQ